MDIAPNDSRSSSNSSRSQRQKLVRFPGRALLILIVLIAPWWPFASQSGWAQATFGLMALVSLAFWWFEQATQKTKQTILPISIIPILLGVCLGIFHYVPWSGDFAKNLGNVAAFERWDELSTPVPADEEIAGIFENEFQIDKNKILTTRSHSISIDPERTRTMIAQLILIAICYFLGAHFFHNRNALLSLCIALAMNGAVIGIFGIIQKATYGPHEIFFGWETVTGGVFGPYVNRNNAAGLLCICMAASAMLITVTFGQDENKPKTADLLSQTPDQKGFLISILRMVHELTIPKIVSVLLFICILAGIFVSLSRGGVIAAVLGSAVSFIIVGLNQKGEKKGAGFLGLAILIGILLVSWLGFGEQLMERFHKAETEEINEHGRIENWTDTLKAVPKAALTGSGLNTYRHIHREFRTTAEEGGNWYLYAENQYYQSLIEGGFVGLVLLLTILGLAIYSTIFLIRMSFSNRGFSVAILSVFALTSQAVAAFFDFGLYIPANFLTFSIIMGAIAGAAQYHANRLKSSPWIIRTGLGRIGIIIMLILFSGGVLTIRDFFRQGEIEQSSRVANQIVAKKYLSTTDEINQALNQIEKLNKKRSSANLYLSAAKLLTHRYQVEVFKERTKGLENLEPEQLDSVWLLSNLTADSLTRMVEVNRFNPLEAKRIKKQFQESLVVKNNLFPAYWNLVKARAVSPMIPKIHFDLADLTFVLTDKSPEPHLKRALSISPMNARYNMLAGIRMLWLSNYDPDDPNYSIGKSQIKKSLDLVPRLYKRIEASIVRTKYHDGVYPGLTAKEFAEEFLADYPELMLTFVRINPAIKNNPTLKGELLTKTIEKSESKNEKRSKNREWALAKIYYEKGDWPNAIKALNSYTVLSPKNFWALELLAKSHIELRQFEKAERIYKQLFARARNDKESKRYSSLLRKMESTKNNIKN